MKLKDRIQSLLIKHPILRDDVHFLCSVIWKGDLRLEGKDINSMSAIELMEMVKEGRLSNFKSIDRLWRLIQERHSELRGREWNKRQGEEVGVRERIREYQGNSPFK